MMTLNHVQIFFKNVVFDRLASTISSGSSELGTSSIKIFLTRGTLCLYFCIDERTVWLNYMQCFITSADISYVAQHEYIAFKSALWPSSKSRIRSFQRAYKRSKRALFDSVLYKFWHPLVTSAQLVPGSSWVHLERGEISHSTPHPVMVPKLLRIN